MGKNYLLEAYLNGLHEIDADGENGGAEKSANNNTANGTDKDDDEIDKAITTPGNSDSGVNTEDIATSPEVCLSSPLTNGSSSGSTDNNNDGKSTSITAKLMDTKSLKDICKRLTMKKGKKEKKQSALKTAEAATNREAKLRMEHESRKEFCAKMKNSNKDNNANNGCTPNESVDNDNTRKPLNVNEHLAGQIELLEKVIAINKHIQREEELLVRLNAKIRKYEVDDPNLTEDEMKKVLDQINSNIESSSSQLLKTEQELNASHKMLMTKSQIVEELSKELEAMEIDDCANQNQNRIQVPSHQIQIHNTNTEDAHELQPNQPEQQPPPYAPAPTMSAQPQETHQTPTPTPIPNGFMKTGTLPKLISSVLKKNTQINAKNTYCGTIPKTQQRTLCNETPSPNVERSLTATSTSASVSVSASASIPTNAIFVAKNQSFLVPDHIILSQAPLFFQKDTFNGNFMQSTDQRNINNTNYTNRTISNLTSSNSINLNNVNINPSMANCGKVGPKKLINGFYKDPDSDTGLSSLGEDGLLHIGTLV